MSAIFSRGADWRAGSIAAAGIALRKIRLCMVPFPWLKVPHPAGDARNAVAVRSGLAATMRAPMLLPAGAS